MSAWFPIFHLYTEVVPSSTGVCMSCTVLWEIWNTESMASSVPSGHLDAGFSQTLPPSQGKVVLRISEWHPVRLGNQGGLALMQVPNPQV